MNNTPKWLGGLLKSKSDLEELGYYFYNENEIVEASSLSDTFSFSENKLLSLPKHCEKLSREEFEYKTRIGTGFSIRYFDSHRKSTSLWYDQRRPNVIQIALGNTSPFSWITTYPTLYALKEVKSKYQASSFTSDFEVFRSVLPYAITDTEMVVEKLNMLSLVQALNLIPAKNNHTPLLFYETVFSKSIIQLQFKKTFVDGIEKLICVFVIGFKPQNHHSDIEYANTTLKTDFPVNIPLDLLECLIHLGSITKEQVLSLQNTLPSFSEYKLFYQELLSVINSLDLSKELLQLSD